MEGEGELRWKDGSRYAGQFENFAMHGNGIFFWATGRKFVGTWKAGKKHGPGKFISKQGVEKKTHYQEGVKLVFDDDEVPEVDSSDDEVEPKVEELRENQDLGIFARE